MNAMQNEISVVTSLMISPKMLLCMAFLNERLQACSCGFPTRSIDL